MRQRHALRLAAALLLTAWFYDPARDEWAQGRVRGKLSPAKRDHHATAYVDGHLYVHGGKLTDQATSALKDLDLPRLVDADSTASRPRSDPAKAKVLTSVLLLRC